ncbi:hypothetical protein ACFVJS_19335 [Nocardioides sp. NPDC057772]
MHQGQHSALSHGWLDLFRVEQSQDGGQAPDQESGSFLLCVQLAA